MVGTSTSQFKLNMVATTMPQSDSLMERVFFNAWSLYVSDTKSSIVKLRKGQFFTIESANDTLVVKLDSIGIGRFRRSYYGWTMKRRLSDTTSTGRFSLPNLDYGYVDCNGYVANPSIDSLTSGKTVGLIFRDSSVVGITPIKITGLGSNILVHNKVKFYKLPINRYGGF